MEAGLGGATQWGRGGGGVRHVGGGEGLSINQKHQPMNGWTGARLFSCQLPPPGVVAALTTVYWGVAIRGIVGGAERVVVIN